MKSRSLAFITGLEPPEPGGAKLCFPAILLPSFRISPEPLPGCCLYPPDIEITSHGPEALWALQDHLDEGQGERRLLQVRSLIHLGELLLLLESIE